MHDMEDRRAPWDSLSGQLSRDRKHGRDVSMAAVNPSTRPAAIDPSKRQSVSSCPSDEHALESTNEDQVGRRSA